jgi:hypothetical protein
MKKRFALAALVAAIPFAVPAQDLSYSYVEGGYDRTTLDEDHGDETDVDGGYIRGSVAIGDSFHLFGRYAKLSGQETSASNSGGHIYDTDLDAGEIGLGYHYALGERVDLTAEVALLDLGIETIRTTRPFFGDRDPYSVTERDVSTNASRVAVGVRGSIAEAVEGWAKGGYVGGGDLDGGYTATLGVQYRFGRVWGVVGEVELAEYWNQMRLGVRASF